MLYCVFPLTVNVQYTISIRQGDDKMTDVLFIVPPTISYKDFINPAENVKTTLKNNRVFGVVITDIPLGVISLSAYIKRHPGVSSSVIDFNVLLNKIDKFDHASFADFFRNVLSNRAAPPPDIIGISSLFSPSYRSMLDLGRICKELFPEAVLVAGGGIPTNMFKEIFSESDCFHGLCYGEGEKPISGLVEASNNMAFLEEDPAWITVKKVESKASFKYDFIENLDEIPFYDYQMLDREGYGLSPTIAAYTSIDEKRKSIPVMTSRGCVYHCSFCAAHTVHGRRMRYHSLKRVKEDLVRLKEEFGAGQIIFQDDHFLSNRERAFNIICIMQELGLTAFFPNSLALYALDRKMLEALKSIGVNQLVLSIESGSERVLKEIMHKPLKLKESARVAADCRSLGIYTDVNILIGLPGETKQDIEDARAFLKSIDANWFRINSATPLPGSEIFEICAKNNWLSGNILDGNYKRAVINTPFMSVEYIQEISYLINLELNFVLNSDMRMGDYVSALKGFENAINAKKDHTIAYYYASLCYEKLGNITMSHEYLDRAKQLALEKPFWGKYIKMFNLPLHTGKFEQE